MKRGRKTRPVTPVNIDEAHAVVWEKDHQIGAVNFAPYKEPSTDHLPWIRTKIATIAVFILLLFLTSCNDNAPTRAEFDKLKNQVNKLADMELQLSNEQLKTATEVNKAVETMSQCFHQSWEADRIMQNEIYTLYRRP